MRAYGPTEVNGTLVGEYDERTGDIALHVPFAWYHPDEVAGIREQIDALTREAALRIREQTRRLETGGDPWAE